ncbi:PREDICTED: probable carbohydrate esterase At4g34215 [Nelumbo nucifera]|uniref:Sialate O-acetylesterase domain-containing protein n=2 Tax=Nelumbo nucifera TaxID=4432 RepID=A0A822ZEC3_NELNU|nr:PREDICTED: probable carbohydrate esterase At4g34215 [Nelumbo nucifera]DAD41366.1 TPA_asm: hypothetical protein HUJ06_015689 [Nelumbo nucifera]
MLSLILFILLAYAWLLKPAQVVHGSGFLYKDIFLLAGQSNMAGRGGVVDEKWDRLVPPEIKPKPSILRFSAKLRWEEAAEPLHADIDVNKTCGVGPGLAFANVIRDKDSSIGVVGLVPCAVGGTNIHEWARGTHLYNQLVRRAMASLNEGGAIRAILWYQGESDTLSKSDAQSYKENLEKFIQNLLSDLNSPMIPIIQVALASGQGPFIETVREAQLGTDLPNVRCVDAKGLPLEVDNLHLTTPAQLTLGEMLADAFLNYFQGSIPITSNAPRR